MVKLTIEQIKKLPPEQRIKYLRKLEEQKKKEIEEAEKILVNSETEIQRQREKEEEEGKKEQEKREIRAIATGNQEKLEEMVRESPAEEAPKAAVYGAPLEELRNIYQIAKPEIYDSIKDLRNTAAERDLTAEEERRLNSYNSAFSQINSVQAAYIRDQQTRVTVLKAKEALDQIKKYESGQ